MQLVLDTNGLTVKKRNNNFWIIHQKGKRLISPHKVSSIAVTSDCFLSTAAIRLAIQHQIPIYFFNRHGKVEGQLWTAGFQRLATIRRQQTLFAETQAASLYIYQLFAFKTQAQIENIKRWTKRQKDQKEIAATIQSELTATLDKMSTFCKTEKINTIRNQLMGLEGIAARRYWQFISNTLPKDWQFKTRSRRPALDYFNVLLNYSYGMLYSVVESALFAAGLDPYLGILHTDEYKRPTFVYDMIEPFRPWIDYLVVSLITENKFNDACFRKTHNGYWLDKKGKHILIPAFNAYLNTRIDWQEQERSRRNHIYYQADQFAKQLLTDVKND